jgi:hypothetical protein
VPEVSFNWEINFGHLITIIGIIGGISSVVYALRSDVKQLKVELAPIKEDLKQLVNVLIQIGRQDEQIKSLTHRLDKLEDR